MNIDTTGYETFLHSKHYALRTISNSTSIVRRLLETTTVENIAEQEADQLIEYLGIKPSSRASKDWYKYQINLFKTYLKTQGAYV